MRQGQWQAVPGHHYLEASRPRGSYVCVSCLLVWSAGPCPACHGGERGDRVLITGYTAGTQEQSQGTVRAEGGVAHSFGPFQKCAGCLGPFLEGDTPPHFEEGQVLHSRLTCALALSARRTAEGAGTSGVGTRLADCQREAGPGDAGANGEVGSGGVDQTSIPSREEICGGHVGNGSVRRCEPSFRKLPSSGLQWCSRAPERGASVLPVSRTLLTPPHSSAPRLAPA